ncbi:MAG: serine/threonine protein kinase [Actinoallomurus sp.]|nr:serine/threonine protein kinase [Actinoallomurus sp.]
MVLGDRYRLIERIAAGGQGEVWRAEDTALGRPVAVKVLRGEYADSAEFRDRFRREARHAAGLSHPGVAQVFDYDEGQGGAPPYLVMEYIDGESLSATIARQGPVGADRALEVIVAVASALAVAHAAGVVHRDVKPGNLLIGQDGSIKITDFGIARAVDAIPLTRTGMLLGTPLYLAPEQASGLPATAASDLYALGVIAFELLTGRPPYEGPAAAVLLAHRDSPFPELPPSVPSGLRDLVLALTAKDPAMRPADAAAVVDRATRLRTDPTMTIPSGAGLDGAPHPFAATLSLPDAARSLPDAGPAGHAAGSVTQVMAQHLAEDPPRRHRVFPLLIGGLAIALVAGFVGWLARPSAPHPPVVVQQRGGSPVVSHSPRRVVDRPPVTYRPPVAHRAPVRHPKAHHGKPPKHKHHH